MVNSGSFDASGSEGESVKAEFTQLEDNVVPRSATSPRHLVGACASEADFMAVVPETETTPETIAETIFNNGDSCQPTRERDEGLKNTLTSLLDLGLIPNTPNNYEEIKTSDNSAEHAKKSDTVSENPPISDTNSENLIKSDASSDSESAKKCGNFECAKNSADSECAKNSVDSECAKNSVDSECAKNSVNSECAKTSDSESESSTCKVVTSAKASLQCSVPLDKVKNVLDLLNPISAKPSNDFLILENYLKQSVKPSETIKPTELTTNTAEKAERVENVDSRPATKRLLCLFCDRTFTSNNLKQKHVGRCHSVGQTRRSSSRTPSHNQSATACCFCSKLNHTNHTLKQLLEHLINEHSNRYYACLSCQERFTTHNQLRDHNQVIHGIQTTEIKSHRSDSLSRDSERSSGRSSERSFSSDVSKTGPLRTESSPETVSKLKRKEVFAVESNPSTEKDVGFQEDFEETIHANVISSADIKKNEEPDLEEETLIRRISRSQKQQQLKAKKSIAMNKKIGVKSTKNGVRNNLRTTRATVQQMQNLSKKNKLLKSDDKSDKPLVKKPKCNPASVFSLVNAYTYKYEKIYDHSSDSIKDANSVQFNAIFDREFYTKTVNNIRENLLNHLDGKLNRNTDSETRISNFEHNPTVPETKPSNTSEKFGCDLSINAVTPVATLLASSQYGEDFDSQIEYGAKASQKKAKKVNVVKYKFTNKKYNSLFRKKTAPHDLTSLDMWTQLTVKKRQHKCHGDDNIESETIIDEQQVEELNRILDKRGSFEDLRMEANAAQMLEKGLELRKKIKEPSDETKQDVNSVIDEILLKVTDQITEKETKVGSDNELTSEDIKAEIKFEDLDNSDLELPSYLQLRRCKNDTELIDKTDKIAMICLAQDGKEIPKEATVELSGEWARPRIYICATCGLKLPNQKSLDDHKHISHPHIWCTHYEFVGKQSDFYRHLCIPGLGNVGVVEKLPANRIWQRSDARTCSKCSKQCHNLGELHRHILECGGDWTWMLARKKCKYRPYGARSRRRRQRGYKRTCNLDGNRVPRQPKSKENYIGPKPKPSKPSDAETIERMLANLPAKRHRKVISMRDGIQRPRKPYKQRMVNSVTNPQSDIVPTTPNKKVIFKNNSHNSPQMATKQTLRNALKRKMRNHNKNIQETNSENVETKLLRSRVHKKENTIEENVLEESEITQQIIGNKSKIRNKRMISRILGSKIFDSSSALVTRRRLVKAITQNNIIRKTRLRTKMAENSQIKNIEEEEELDEKLDKAALKSKDVQIDKKVKNVKVQNLEEDSKASKSESLDIQNEISKDSKDTKTAKKSNSKRLLSALTKSAKKTKNLSDKKDDLPLINLVQSKTVDTIDAVINDVINNSCREEEVAMEEEIKPVRKTRNSNLTPTLEAAVGAKANQEKIVSPKIKKRNGIKKVKSVKTSDKSSVKTDVDKDNDNVNTEVITLKKSDSTVGKIIKKKANKILQNIKSFKKVVKNCGSTNIDDKLESEGIASKLIRTLSMRGSKKKKAKKLEKESTNTEEVETKIKGESSLKKTTSEENIGEIVQDEKMQNENVDLGTNTNAANNVQKTNDVEINDSLKVAEETEKEEGFLEINKNEEIEIMPTLEKIEPIPKSAPIPNVTESIPILTPICVNSNLPTLDSNMTPNISNQTDEDKKIDETTTETSDSKSIETLNINSTSNLNKFKNKIKRTGKGLNDCIAMLRCKLEQKSTNNESSLTDKSNLFILNSTEVIKHSAPIEPEFEEINPTEEKIDVCEKENSREVIPEIIPEVKITEKSLEKPIELESPVLEIPCVPNPAGNTQNVETLKSDILHFEKQEIVPDFAANIQNTLQISYVLNAAMKNCLMECVKNKCEELKHESQVITSNKVQVLSFKERKIGSVRKRKRRSKEIKVNTSEKHIPNVPVLVNSAILKTPRVEKLEKHKIDIVKTVKEDQAARINTVKLVKVVTKDQVYSSDEDVPLSKLVTNPIPVHTKLKIKIPVNKKKRRSRKKKIGFTPLILNNQENCVPQISLDDKIEQHIALDNSMNNRIEAIQAEITAKESENISENINENTDISEAKEESAEELTLIGGLVIEHQVSETTEENSTEREENFTEREENLNLISVSSVEKLSEKCDSIDEIVEETINISFVDIVPARNLVVTESPIKEIKEGTSNFRIEGETIDNLELERNIVENPLIEEESNARIEDNIQETEKIDDVYPEENLIKDIAENLNPLSQQIMKMEDEPCDIYLLNKTLTEANIEPIPVKSNFQNFPSSENSVNESYIDSGKENSEEKPTNQRIKKHKKIAKKIKNKRRARTKIKISSPHSEIAQIMDSSLDLSSKLDAELNISETEPICLESEIQKDLKDLNNFAGQLPVTLESEPETDLMENKNICDIHTKEKILSDSEDELPLAQLVKIKTNGKTNEPEISTEIDQSEISDNSSMLNAAVDVNIANESEVFDVENKIEEKLQENLENEIISQVDEGLSNNLEQNLDFNLLERTPEPLNLLENELSNEIIENTEAIIAPILTNSASENINLESTSLAIVKSEHKTKPSELIFNLLKTPVNKPTNNEYITTPDLADGSLVIKIQKNFKVKLKKPKKSRRRVIPKSLGRNNIKRKDNKDDEMTNFLCEICNKTFRRKENLTSHKRTLTHIAKLSEIEARESFAKRAEMENNDESTGTQETICKEAQNVPEEVKEAIDENIEPELKINDDVESTQSEEKIDESETESTPLVVISSTIKEIDNFPKKTIVEKEMFGIIDSDRECSLDSIQSLQIETSPEKIMENIITDDDIEAIEIEKPVSNLLPGIVINSTNSNLKLADIINEVLDKPVNNLKLTEAEYLSGGLLSPENDINYLSRRLSTVSDVSEIAKNSFSTNIIPENDIPIDIIDSSENSLPEKSVNSEIFDSSKTRKEETSKIIDVENDEISTFTIESSNDSDANDKISVSEPKRYKSLGERKSFDSDNFALPQTSNEETSDYGPVRPVNSVNNGLLSEQLCLLENIIEKRNPNLNYIDDTLSLSSNQFDEPLNEQNMPEKDLFRASEYANKLYEQQIKFSHNNDVISSFIKPINHFPHFENISQQFAKPAPQYEEVSQGNFEEEAPQKSKENSTRKILNRDEELFLECCSLLKSGSEMSKKSKQNAAVPVNNFSLSNDSNWTQRRPDQKYIQRDSYSWLAHAQGSRVNTPIGEPFVNNDWSNSNSGVSSEWLAQKAPSPDKPTENNTLTKKNNNNSGEIKYSDIQFEDISVDSSIENSNTLAKTENPASNENTAKTNENVPLNFHNVGFSNAKENAENLQEIETEKVSVDDYQQDLGKDLELKIEEKIEERDEFDAELKKQVVSNFGGLMAKALSNRLHAVVRRSKKSRTKRDVVNAIQSSIMDYTVPMKKSKGQNNLDSDSSEGRKKFVSKGAMKVFEGVKVSIPTQDLNLTEVLNCSSKPKPLETTKEPIRETNGNLEDEIVESKKNSKKKNVFGRFGNKLGLRETKKKQNRHRSSTKTKNNFNNETHDVYDFEESLDSNFAFQNGAFPLFRRETLPEKPEVPTTENITDIQKVARIDEIMSEKWNIESDSDTDRYYDSMSFKEGSSSSESTQESITIVKKPQKRTEKSKENQKKCMIMGRIFKNASKPKLEDKIPEIRDFSSDENSKVENYIGSCSSVDNVECGAETKELPNVPINPANPVNVMSKKDMDLLFDKLLEEEKKTEDKSETLSVGTEDIPELPLTQPVLEHLENHTEKNERKEKQKSKQTKCKKRSRQHSEGSTSDEFTLHQSKSSKKNHNKVSRRPAKCRKETGINLEQEMKECIGVAGRKSQRKCTSGKQNVLAEFWSSDESSFEDLIKLSENQNVDQNIEENKIVPEPEIDQLTLNTSNSASLSEPPNLNFAPKLEIPIEPKKMNLDIYEFESELESLDTTSNKQPQEASNLHNSRIKISKRNSKSKPRSRKHSKTLDHDDETDYESERNKRREQKRKQNLENKEIGLAISRRKRNAGEMLYYWSSSSDDELQDLIEVKPIRDDNDDDRPMQHGWIVGDSPKKLVTMLAQAKGKKIEGESVKEQKKNRVTL